MLAQRLLVDEKSIEQEKTAGFEGVPKREEERALQIPDIDDGIVKYVNRLSDLLFTMARFVNYKEKQTEISWKKK